MIRNNPPSDREQELNDLIARYEAMKVADASLYLDGDQLADIADKYAAERRFAEAQEVISYGLGLHPDNTDLMIEQAYLYLDLNKPQKAKQVAECITDTYSTEVKLLKAELLLSEGKLDAAEILLDTIEEKDDLNTIIDVANLYIDLGYPESAIHWLKIGLPKYSDNEDFLAVTANCHYSGDQLARAEFFYNKLIDKNPYNPEYWVGLAKCHFSESEFDKALEACDFAIAADEFSGEAHVLKAHCLFHLENENEAVVEYQKALDYKAIPPEFAYMFMGLACNNKEEWERSLGYFEQASSIIKENDDNNSPLLSDVYINAALCHSKLGQQTEAHSLCDQAKQIAPSYTEVYLIEGRIYMEEGEEEKAREQWDIALQYAPDAETWMQVGGYSLEYNLIEYTRFCYEQALKLDPDYPGINEQLASICVIQKDYEAFNKYNDASETPFNFDVLYKALKEIQDDKENPFIEEIKDSLDHFKKKKSDNNKKK